jgi:hypothetical protein
MSMLTRRLQVLVAPEQYERLQVYANGRGVSVGEAVRDAIDRVARPAPERRLEALERLLAAEPVDLPADVADLEREIDGMYDQT